MCETDKFNLNCLEDPNTTSLTLDLKAHLDSPLTSVDSNPIHVQHYIGGNLVFCTERDLAFLDTASHYFVTQFILPEEYRLGLEERGPQMNHSGRTWSNFGNSRTPVFPGGKDGKQESRNWLASFTKSGYLNCRDENSKVTHKTRSGDPVILVIGDEAAPTVVGHTEKGSSECTCA